MSKYYQLILLGNTGSIASQKVKERFFALLKERGMEANIIDVMNGTRTMASPSDGGYDSRKPTFAFYFGSQTHGNRDVPAIQKLMSTGDAIYPIFFTHGQFKQEIPDVLHTVNGECYIDDKLDSIVNVAFEELRLLRKKRRVFISYKRSESAAVANQLYDILSRCQFDVFLDTYSIRGAVDFQAELKHRITDSDVLIQLNSPNFMDSVWCKKEISEANARRVGVLQVNWPGIKQSESDQLCAVFNLEDWNFRRSCWKNASSTLKNGILNEISSQVEAIRARNLAARQDNLIGEFVKEANRQGRTIIKEPAFLVERKNNDRFWYFIPAIGVPQSVDCQESVKLSENWNQDKLEKVFLLYDDLSILPRWVDHLEWLNEYLDVKTIKKQDFEKWLKTNK